MMTTAKTSLHFTDLHFLHHDEVHQQKIKDDFNRIHQHEMTTNELMDGIRITKFLGEGSFGVAFSCEFSNPHQAGLTSSYVIKLPVKLIEKIPEYRTRLVDQPLRDIFSMHLSQAQRSSLKTVLLYAIRDFRYETQNAEAILQPPIYKLRQILHTRQLKPHKSDRHANLLDAGKNLQNLTVEEYAKLIKDMGEIRQHPGHAHWHPILHVDLTIPCIISSHADGTLSELVQCMTEKGHGEMYFHIGNERQHPNPPKIWLTIAYQMGLAIEYMKEFSEKVHSDIKPENVLYRFEALDGVGKDRKLHLWISDYGICEDKGPISNEIIQTRHFNGTICFTPQVRDNAGWLVDPRPPYVAVTIYQYMMTLITSLVYECPHTGEVKLLIRDQFPDDRRDIFDPRRNVYQIIESLRLRCKNRQHQAVWLTFRDLIYFKDPHTITILFEQFMKNIKELRSTENFDFVMSDEEYMFYIHDVQKPQELILGADRGLPFADPDDPIVEGGVNHAKGVIGPYNYVLNTMMPQHMYLRHLFPKSQDWVGAGGGGRMPLACMFERVRWDCMKINGASTSSSPKD